MHLGCHSSFNYCILGPSGPSSRSKKRSRFLKKSRLPSEDINVDRRFSFLDYIGVLRPGRSGVHGRGGLAWGLTWSRYHRHPDGRGEGMGRGRDPWVRGVVLSRSTRQSGASGGSRFSVLRPQIFTLVFQGLQRLRDSEVGNGLLLPG